MTPAVFSHGDLRIYLLSLLAEEPLHGYGIIQALSERTGGTYTPSAGTVYPRLAKLEEEGLVTKRADGRTTIYSISDTGRAELASRESEIAGIESGITDSVRLIADQVRQNVQEAMRSLRADLSAAKETAASTASTTQRDEKVASREQLHRADAAITAFRARVSADLRSHVARGGMLSNSVVTSLETALNDTAHDVIRALSKKTD